MPHVLGQADRQSQTVFIWRKQPSVTHNGTAAAAVLVRLFPHDDKYPRETNDLKEERCFLTNGSSGQLAPLFSG